MSQRPKITLTRRYPDSVLERAERDYAVTVNWNDTVWNGDDLIAAAEGFDGMLISSGNKLTADVIKRLPESVKIVASYSVGYEHVDMEAAKARGLVTTNTPDVLTESTADTALLHLLAASRRAREAMTMVIEGRWTGWQPQQLLGVQPGGRRLGILGMGRIGRALAHRARALGLEIHYHNRSRLADDLEQGAVYHNSARDLFSVSDFLSIHCEMTPETEKLLNAETIELLPENAVIINTARGGIIDEDALIAALNLGRVFAAGLEVFAGEPKLDPRYRVLKNAFVTPHIGSATLDTRNAMGFRALDNLDAFFRGEDPPDRLT